MIDTRNLTINERIARYRKMAGLRQEDVARRMGMKLSTYSQMERVGEISAARLIQIAEVLGVEPVVLLLGEQDRSIDKNKFKELLEATAPVNQNLPKSTEIFEPKPEPIVRIRGEEQIMKIMPLLSNESRKAIFEFVQKIYEKEIKKR